MFDEEMVSISKMSSHNLLLTYQEFRLMKKIRHWMDNGLQGESNGFLKMKSSEVCFSGRNSFGNFHFEKNLNSGKESNFEPEKIGDKETVGFPRIYD